MIHKKYIPLLAIEYLKPKIIRDEIHPKATPIPDISLFYKNKIRPKTATPNPRDKLHPKQGPNTKKEINLN